MKENTHKRRDWGRKRFKSGSMLGLKINPRHAGAINGKKYWLYIWKTQISCFFQIELRRFICMVVFSRWIHWIRQLILEQHIEMPVNWWTGQTDSHAHREAGRRTERHTDLGRTTVQGDGPAEDDGRSRSHSHREVCQDGGEDGSPLLVSLNAGGRTHTHTHTVTTLHNKGARRILSVSMVIIGNDWCIIISQLLNFHDPWCFQSSSHKQ